MNTCSSSTEIAILADGRLTTKMASLYLGISVKTLANHRSKGIGCRYCKIYGRIFYLKNDLDTWVSEQTVRSTAEYRRKKDQLVA